MAGLCDGGPESNMFYGLDNLCPDAQWGGRSKSDPPDPNVCFQWEEGGGGRPPVPHPANRTLLLTIY